VRLTCLHCEDISKLWESWNRKIKLLHFNSHLLVLADSSNPQSPLSPISYMHWIWCLVNVCQWIKALVVVLKAYKVLFLYQLSANCHVISNNTCWLKALIYRWKWLEIVLGSITEATQTVEGTMDIFSWCCRGGKGSHFELRDSVNDGSVFSRFCLMRMLAKERDACCPWVNGRMVMGGQCGTVCVEQWLLFELIFWHHWGNKQFRKTGQSHVMANDAIVA